MLVVDIRVILLLSCVNIHDPLSLRAHLSRRHCKVCTFSIQNLILGFHQKLVHLLHLTCDFRLGFRLESIQCLMAWTKLGCSHKVPKLKKLASCYLYTDCDIQWRWRLQLQLRRGRFCLTHESQRSANTLVRRVAHQSSAVCEVLFCPRGCRKIRH